METSLKQSIVAEIDEVNNLLDRMNGFIAEFVQSKGGIIDTRNERLYGLTCDTYEGDYIEYQIAAIKTDDKGNVSVLFDRDDTIDYDATEEEFKSFCLNECNDFTPIFDGYVLQSATLLNISKMLLNICEL